MNTIAARIKEARKRARLSQEALARRAGMSTNGVARIEQGGIADPHYSTLVGIADALGLSLGELLDKEPVLSSGKAEAPAVRGTEKLPEGFDDVVTFAERVSEWARLYGDHAEARLGRAIEAGEFPAFEYQELLATARYTKGRFEEETAALPSYDKLPYPEARALLLAEEELDRLEERCLRVFDQGTAIARAATARGRRAETGDTAGPLPDNVHDLGEFISKRAS